MPAMGGMRARKEPRCRDKKDIDGNIVTAYACRHLRARRLGFACIRQQPAGLRAQGIAASRMTADKPPKNPCGNAARPLRARRPRLLPDTCLPPLACSSPANYSLHNAPVYVLFVSIFAAHSSPACLPLPAWRSR